jgi:hypothetical protein
MIIAGIDPGLNGGLAFLTSNTCLGLSYEQHLLGLSDADAPPDACRPEQVRD